MNLDFTCICLLDNPSHTILKIKSNQPSDLSDSQSHLQWLLVNKENMKIQQLIIQSMDSSGPIQERFFEQGYLKFNDQSATYIEKFNTAQHQLENKTGTLPATAMQEAIQSYLNEQN